MAILDYVLFGSEQRQQMRALRFAMSMFFWFIVSGAMSYSEMKYMIFGVTARANAAVIKRSESGKSDWVKIQYDFKDQQGERHEARTDLREHNLDDARAEDHTVEVVYMSGSPDTNKLTIERNKGWMVMFGVMVAVVIAWCAIIYFNAVKDEKPVRKRKR